MEEAITKGLVLYSRPYKERDRLIKIYTEKYGKCQFFIKNAAISKFAASLQTFTTAELIATINDSGFSFVHDISEVKHYQHILEDFEANAYASYVVSLADIAIEDGEYDSALYSFLIQVLNMIDIGKDVQIMTNIFELQILSRFGAGLNLSECVICGRKDLPMDYSFSYNACLCKEHFDKDLRRLHVQPNVIYMANKFLNISLEVLESISVKENMKKQLRNFIDSLYDEYVGLETNAKKFINNMDNWADIMKK
ncbi:DNA repair protein RecO [Lactovum miscens]|uniref:DNA repair protein RecO n=1 Tax=Lactovum miscens TaxID=190387 RepID=A0A841C733_9LACT|nr:DNA repair protein RecO [Lactovum miscens]MBB5887361.1 DNA repair protein RecO (recombination protein O) [Lactovum miscens]